MVPGTAILVKCTCTHLPTAAKLKDHAPACPYRLRIEELLKDQP